jgi:hypothetical protein
MAHWDWASPVWKFPKVPHITKALLPAANVTENDGFLALRFSSDDVLKVLKSTK